MLKPRSLVRPCLLLVLVASTSVRAQVAPVQELQELPSKEVSLVLTEARQLARWGHLRQALQLVEQRVRQLPADPPLASGYHRLVCCVAQIHFQSQKYDEALQWATTCHDYLAGLPDPEGELVTARQEVLLLLADTHAQLAQSRQTQSRQAQPKQTQLRQTQPSQPGESDQHRAQAVGRVQEAIALEQTWPHRQDTVWKLGALTRLGRLLAGQENRAQRSQIDRQIDHWSATLEEDYQARRTSLAQYDSGVRSVADYLRDTQRADDAIACLKKLLAIYDQPPLTHRLEETQRRAGICSEMARAHRSIEAWPDEIVAIQRAIELWKNYSTKLPEQRSGQMQRTFSDLQLADLYQRLGAAHTDAGDTLKGELSWKAALAHYRQVLLVIDSDIESDIENETDKQVQSDAPLARRQQGVAADEPSSVRMAVLHQRQRATTLELAALQGLQSITSRLVDELDTTGDDAAIDDLIHISRQVHDRLETLLSAGDPRRFRAKVQLGELFVRQQQWNAALPYLLAARDYWQQCEPPNYLLAVRTLELLSRTERALARHAEPAARADRLQRAYDDLLEAESISKTELAASHQSLVMLIMARLGRLEYELGNPDRADSRFREMQGLASKMGDRDSQLWALELVRTLAMSQLRFEKALAAHKELVNMRPDSGSADSQQRLDDLVVSANLQIANEDIDEAAESLKKATRLAASGSQRSPAVDHLLAMLGLLRARESLGRGESPLAADVESARKLWYTSLVDLDAKEFSSDPSLSKLARARTYHYLARLRFLQWKGAFESWQKTYQTSASGHSATYEVRREKHQQRVEDYKPRVDAYEFDLQQYKKQPRAVTTESPAEHRGSRSPTITAGERLEQRWKNLVIERDSLRKLGDILEQEYDATTAGVRQLRSGPTRDLLQMLREADRFAEQSLVLLEELSYSRSSQHDPTFHYLALCNQVEVLLAELVMLEDQPARLEQICKTAIAKLTTAVRIMVQPRELEFGALDPEKFHSTNKMAADLIFRFQQRIDDRSKNYMSLRAQDRPIGVEQRFWQSSRRQLDELKKSIPVRFQLSEVDMRAEKISSHHLAR